MVDENREPRGVQDLLSANLRRLRIARRLSLSELARATGMSKATLSGIENARANPTVETLAALAGALGVGVVELLGDAPLGEVRVVRASRASFGERDGLAHRPLDGLASPGRVELAEISLPVRQLREVDPKPAGTRVGLFVLAGQLIAGPVERSTELTAGDYVAFPADVAHLYETAARPARGLVLTHTPASPAGDRG